MPPFWYVTVTALRYKSMQLNSCNIRTMPAEGAAPVALATRALEESHATGQDAIEVKFIRFGRCKIRVWIRALTLRFSRFRREQEAARAVQTQPQPQAQARQITPAP